MPSRRVQIRNLTRVLTVTDYWLCDHFIENVYCTYYDEDPNIHVHVLLLVQCAFTRFGGVNNYLLAVFRKPRYKKTF